MPNYNITKPTKICRINTIEEKNYNRPELYKKAVYNAVAATINNALFL